HMNIPAHFTVHIHISVSIHDTTPTAIYTLSLHDALPISYYGKNRLYHNRHGTFEEVADTAGVAGDGKTWGSGCAFVDYDRDGQRSEEHTSELQSHLNLVCRLLLEKKKDNKHLLACRTEPH